VKHPVLLYHERISKKQDGSLVGKTPSFRGEYSLLFIHKLCAFLGYSNHKHFFFSRLFASITSAPHPLEKSWLQPCMHVEVACCSWSGAELLFNTCANKLFNFD